MTTPSAADGMLQSRKGYATAMMAISSGLARSLLDRERQQLATPRNRVDVLAARVGLGLMYRQRRKGVASIFGYHSVGDPHCDPGDPRMILSVEQFTRSMEFLARHRRVVPIGQLVDTMVQDRPIDPHTVVITIDDGYEDTLHVALPILERFELPATVYLSTSYIGTGSNMPIDDVYWSFTTRRSNLLPAHMVPPELRELGPDTEMAAFDVIGGRLIDMRPDDRDAEILAVREALDPADPPPSRMLDWNGVRALASSDLITLGVHPHRHADLRAFEDLLIDEIMTTRDLIESETGYRPVDASYAYNRQGPNAAAQVEAMGFRSAMGAAWPPFVSRGSSPYDLVRYDGPREVALLRAWSL